jgi:hypothetical protein
MTESTSMTALSPPKFQRLEFCDETSRSMGEFMFAWSILERELDLGVAAIFRVNPTLSTCITANLGTRTKIDMLRSGLSMLKPCLGDALVEEAIDTLSEIAKLTGAARTPVAHGQPIVFDDEDGGGWFWVRQQARVTAKMSVYDKPEEHWRYQGAVIMLYAEGWSKLVSTIYITIKDLMPQQIDDACEINPTVIANPFRRKG